MNLDPDGLLERWCNQWPNGVVRGRAITGHLWIRKYDHAMIRLRATVLRHPVQRLISHYFFWLSPVSLPEHPLRSYALKHQLDIVQFAQLPIIRMFYADHLFRGVDMRSFDFICDSRDLSNDWSHILNRLGLDVRDRTEVNTTRSHVADYHERRGDIVSNLPLMRRLEDFLADDIRFYENALGS